MFLFIVRSVVYALKTFLNLAHTFITDKRSKNCQLMLRYAMIRYVTVCTTYKSSTQNKRLVSGMKHRMQRESIPKEVHHISRFSLASCGIRERLYRSCQRNKNPKALQSPKTSVQQCRSRNANASRGVASIPQKRKAKKMKHFFFLEKKKVFYSSKFQRQEGATGS
jgi:hypothetical protein